MDMQSVMFKLPKMGMKIAKKIISTLILMVTMVYKDRVSDVTFNATQKHRILHILTIKKSFASISFIARLCKMQKWTCNLSCLNFLKWGCGRQKKKKKKIQKLKSRMFFKLYLGLFNLHNLSIKYL